MATFRQYPRLSIEAHEEYKRIAPTLGMIRRTSHVEAETIHDNVIGEIRRLKDILYSYGFMETSSSSDGHSIFKIFKRTGPKRGSIEILTLIHTYILEHGHFCGFEYVMSLCGRHGDSDTMTMGSGTEMFAKCVSLTDIIEEADDYFGVETMKQLH